MKLDKETLILITILALLFIGLDILILFIDFNQETSYSQYSSYEFYADKFSSDSIILNISDYCSDSFNPVRCVFDLIPMDYDDSRVGQSEPAFRNPGDYFVFGGVCRDFVILRASALDNLGIHCMFDFSKSHHVFLVCAYGDDFYVLNNQYFYRY